ncbi:M3 family metallopeptidase [Coralloluteibacterium stylophorae]|uniref:oligopeptidase A n=2 Tax=Coralloluteibacterium stylophorae TaxID=1776034 RepID=A0AAP2FZS6_9GAMM|nr:M3 family metallopeptidase [Coralloluteibacterium stylophorae]MBS7457065.1 M3 family metallopeptidase [Coralloluteibacterium stylophorae]
MTTPTPNPLLAAGALPAFSAITPAHVRPAVDAVLADYRSAVERLVADPQARSFETLMAPLERWDARLEHVWSPVGHLHGVKDSPELREVHADAEEALTDFATELGQNRALFEAVQALRGSGSFAALDRAQQTLVEDSLRDFRLSGVALEGDARARFAEIENRLSKLSTEFGEAVLDATDAWTRPVTAAELAGLPDSARAILAQAAKDKGSDGHLATLKGPAVQAVMTYADDRDLRREVYTASATRASDQGPHDAKYDNSQRIEEILALRHESARLLGFESAAHLSLADKMAVMPERVLGFLRELAAKAKPVAERELAELAQFAKDELGLDRLEPWDVAWASEKLRARRFDFSDEDIKPYFPLDAAIAGLFTVAERAFGVRLREREGVDRWHPDARYYDVLDADGSVRAGFYVDVYARDGKRGGAWMDVCRGRIRGDVEDPQGPEQKPVAYLVCNFAPPSGGRPALLTHDDVLTLFHEFGHGLHHLLTEVSWPSVGGIGGVEWDAVELPSQFLENFAWARETLDLFARHHETNEPLPQALYDKMLAARHFHAGLFLVRQLEFALFDFRVHLEFDPARGARALEILDAVREEVAVIRPPAWHRFPHAFTHVFAGGYAAGYYSYLWAEVLSADAFAAFEEAAAAGGQVLDAETGARFRREILAVGGSRPALESFVAFRGREPEPGALLRSYGLAA